MEIKDDEIEVTPEEEVIQEEEIVEQPEVSEESDPATIQDEEEEDRIVTIGEPVPEEEIVPEEAPNWVKKVRKVNRKLESENKRLKRELEVRLTETVKPVELGEKPTLASVKYDDVKYEKDLLSYYERKRQIEGQASEKAKTVEEQNKDWQSRQEKYVSQKQEHNFKDYSEVEELVSNTLSLTQQNVLVQGADDAALVVYALGKTPKKLAELAAITNPVNFAVAMSKVESQLKVTSKKAPKPEGRVKATKAGGTSGNTDKVLERLRSEAEKSGDYTQISAYKRKLRNKDK